MPHEGYFNKIFNTRVALPHILLETIITCKNNHMQENEKSKQKKEKNTKQCNHKYEIMSNGNDLKRARAQFTYLKCMILCSMKKK